MKKIFIFFMMILILSIFSYGAIVDGILTNYNFDEPSGNLTDQADSNDGTNIGADYGANGIINDAYAFVASNSDHVNITPVVGDLQSDTAGTWTAWINLTDATPSAVNTIIMAGSSTANVQMILQIQTDGNLSFQPYGDVSFDDKVLTDAQACSDGTWCFVAIAANQSDLPVLYVDGAAVAQTGGETGWFADQTATNVMSIGRFHNGVATQAYFDGIIDEVNIFQERKSPDEIFGLYNSGLGLAYPFGAGDTTSPTILLNYKIPSDFSSLNTVGNPINITYNISDASGLDETSPILFYKSNSTERDWWYSTNGTSVIDYQNMYFTGNLSKMWYIDLDDNDVLPATYNFPQDYLETAPKLVYDLDSINEFVMIEFFNITDDTLSFVEIMVNNSDNGGTQSLPIFYCNSTYTTGNPKTVDSCFNFYNLPAQTPYNHSHHDLTHDQVMPFNIIDGYIGDVKITSRGYIGMQGKSGINSYDLYYIINESRKDAFRYSADNGNTYSNFSGTPVVHIHQFNLNTSFYMYACANDTLNNYGCSSIDVDSFEIDPLPPNPPIITYPNESGNYNNTVIITYTNATSALGEIVYYNISLVDVDENFIDHIQQNNSLNLTFNWDTVSFSDGEYIIRVRAYDNFSLFADGLSINFSIDNAPPTQIWTFPNELNTSETIANVSVNLAGVFYDSNIIYAYNVTIYSPDGGKFISFNISGLTGISYNFSQNITPPDIGSYLLVSHVFDAHTGPLIDDYVIIQESDKLIFDFTTDRYSTLKDTINITDRSYTPPAVIQAIKAGDRYLFYFDYGMAIGKEPYIWRKYRIESADLHLIGTSKYNAHFVDFYNKKWIDFESDKIKTTLIYECGNNCYDVQLYVENTANITFNSIGDLNEGTESHIFLVTATPATPVDLLNLGYCALQTTAQAIIYAFLYIVLLSLLIISIKIVKVPIVTVVVGVGFIGFALSLFACAPIIAAILVFVGLAISITAVLATGSMM